jgi:hypothetical protein
MVSRSVIITTAEARIKTLVSRDYIYKAAAHLRGGFFTCCFNYVLYNKNMSLEQMEFLIHDADGMESGGDSNSLKEKIEQEKPADESVKSKHSWHKPKDGLEFDCEYCQDSPGGCSMCGFGRNS